VTSEVREYRIEPRLGSISVWHDLGLYDGNTRCDTESALLEPAFAKPTARQALALPETGRRFAFNPADAPGVRGP
jgi:hypothetical protein